MNEPEVTLFPAWKQAVRDFLAAGFKPGDMVPHDWLQEHFDMGGLSDGASLTLQEYRDRQFKWLQSVEAFKAELLEDHQIYLASVYGEGYRWVPPREQTGLAMEKFEREAKRVFRQAALRLKHVRAGELTDDQRRQNIDAIGKMSAIRGMTRKALR